VKTASNNEERLKITYPKKYEFFRIELQVENFLVNYPNIIFSEKAHRSKFIFLLFYVSRGKERMEYF